MRYSYSIKRSQFFLIQIMNINDKSVLEMLNKHIAINRLNKTQILQMVNLVSISNNIDDLKDNLKWESSKSSHQNTLNIKTNIKQISITNLK